MTTPDVIHKLDLENRRFRVTPLDLATDKGAVDAALDQAHENSTLGPVMRSAKETYAAYHHFLTKGVDPDRAVELTGLALENILEDE